MEKLFCFLTFLQFEQKHVHFRHERLLCEDLIFKKYQPPL